MLFVDLLREWAGIPLRCIGCGRTQAVALENRAGGVTVEEAQRIGWTCLQGDHWLCPLCGPIGAAIVATRARRDGPKD